MEFFPTLSGKRCCTLVTRAIELPPVEPYNTFVQLRQALHSAITRLETAAIEEPRLQAEVLIFFVLGCDRAYLYAHPERELSRAELAQYELLASRRASGEPLQYLTGHQEFWRCDFLVTPAVLIPRPETEHLIEAVLALVGNDEPLRLVDVGTGSGVIAITLARELPQAAVLGVDLSPAALEVARLNAERLGATVEFAQSDVLGAVVRDGSFDFVVSNPPYIGRNEERQVQDTVKHYEPAMALFAGDDGLEVIRRLIPQAREVLRPGGWLLMEVGYTQSEAVQALLAGWQSVRAVADLAGIARVIVARKPA